MMKDVIEYYSTENNVLLLSVKSSMVPSKDTLISLRGKTWQVSSVTYAVDYVDDQAMRSMRANVNLTPQV